MVDVDDIDSIEDNTKILSPKEEYQETLIFNNGVREIFLNRFVQMFSSYEHFVIQPSQVYLIQNIKINLYRNDNKFQYLLYKLLYIKGQR